MLPISASLTSSMPTISSLSCLLRCRWTTSSHSFQLQPMTESRAWQVSELLETQNQSFQILLLYKLLRYVSYGTNVMSSGVNDTTKRSAYSVLRSGNEKTTPVTLLLPVTCGGSTLCSPTKSTDSYDRDAPNALPKWKTGHCNGVDDMFVSAIQLIPRNPSSHQRNGSRGYWKTVAQKTRVSFKSLMALVLPSLESTRLPKYDSDLRTCIVATTTIRDYQDVLTDF